MTQTEKVDVLMEKPADTQYPVHELIRERWSPRAFADRSLEPGRLQSLLEAARWAPSCFNEQPWRFIVAERADEEEFQSMVDCLTPLNQAWAKEAAVLILSVAAKTFERNDNANRHALHDVGLSVMQLILQATADGLHAHQMAGFDSEQARRTYSIPEGFEPVAVVAIGYAGDPELLAEELRERELAPRSRRSQEEFVFRGTWGRHTVS